MRKIFANLKSVVALAVVAAMTLSVSCMYDDTALTKRVSKVEKDLAALTEKVNGLAGQEVTLENLLAGNLVITGVTTDAAGNTVVSLSNGEFFTVLAEAETLQYRTENGVLEISADGETWVAVTADAACLVKEVRTNADGTITIVFANGTEFTGTVAELIECEATRSQVYVIAGTTKAVRFTINDAVEDINVMNQPFGWSATVEEYVEVEEDDFGGGIMPLAAGGKEYVLNITGPAAKLVNEGLAAKEGVVSVHFNTAAGACKVMNVAVNLAEVTLNVDAAGNITITNTMATEQTDHWGEKFTDFADFHIGVMPKALYDEQGNNAIRNDEDGVVATTMRSTGLWNVADLRNYEEGVYEKEVIELTVDQLGGAFDPVYNFEIGGEYVFFISLEEEMINYYVYPILDNAIFASYKKSIVEASVVEGSATWNDATLNLSLAGYTMYKVGWMSVDEFNMLNESLGAASFEEFLPTWLGADGNYRNGAIIDEDMIDVNRTISELAMYGGASVLPGTEYYLYVYPFNAQNEMEFYMHQVIAENIVFCGTFETAALKVGQFETAAEYTNVEHFEDSISVDVEFTGDATTIVYNWINEPSIDPALTIAEIFADYYTQYVDVYEGTAEFNASHSPYDVMANPIYLAMIVINANGEYVYLEKEFTYIEPEPIALTSFEYQGRHLDIDDNPETSGGDHVYIAKAVDGTELTIGLYYTYADENGVITPGEYDYCANYFDAMYSYWNGFVIVSDTRYYDSKLIVTEDTVKIKIKGGNIYLFDKNAAPVEPEQPAEPEVVAFTSATVAPADDYLNYHYITFTDGTYNAIIKLCTRGTTEYVAGLYDQNGSFSDATTLYIGGYSTDCTWNGAECWPVTMEVIDNGDGTATFNLVYNEYPSAVQHKGTYTGVLEGLTLVEPKQPEAGDVITYTIQKLTVGYDQPGEKEMQFWYSETGAHVIDFKGFDNCNPGQPLAAGTYSSAAYTIDASYSIFDYGTTNGTMSSVECVVTDNGDGTYTYDAKFSYSGQNYAFVYTGAYPM